MYRITLRFTEDHHDQIGGETEAVEVTYVVDREPRDLAVATAATRMARRFEHVKNVFEVRVEEEPFDDGGG